MRADVQLRPPPDGAELALRIDLDTAVIEARVVCAVPAVAGIRRAVSVVATPEWMRVRVGHVEALPGFVSFLRSPRSGSACPGVPDRLRRCESASAWRRVT